ncbi:benzoate-CoA ligase family protein [Planosporangium mesophilum]|uniref:Benzoate--CoA ligase n=1 Tax=Planosporangium mesophilum TaxID=689768 RepID=A0A8J3X761_9ACTN|nr:benzoate-CoA ligase family protein [Planosporangium mesophilum]NJC86862.1 benzoate-CoA ligase family protein [Planosporangium mesophilum]GII26373.1 benzoate--CoA ligase [Planosporangium mesophilum]
MPDRLNAAEYLVDRHVQEGNGDRTAVLTPRRALTYAQLGDEMRRVAAGLASLGVRPEERVMFCMADDVELLSGILGAMYLGAVPVPVSTMCTGPELATVLVDSRARVLCASGEFADVVRTAVGLAPEVTTVIFDGQVGFDELPAHRWDEVRGEPSPLPAYPTWPDSPALWLYTSGTTGRPKAAMHRHASIPAVATCYGSGVLGMGPGDRCLSVAKLFFAYGLGNSAFFPLAAGATTVLERARPTPEVMAARAIADRPTLFFGVPTFYAALLASDIPDDSFASVRQGVSAGEALPPALFRRFRERFGVEILDGIGSTEALHIFISNRPGRAVAGTSGTPVPGYDVEIRDERGGAVTATGTPGDLYLRGPSTAVGYWCRTETTREVFHGEWMRTGDTYQRNDDGTYTCLGRSNDMLKAGGIWVSPVEVEERLLEHPGVAQVAVVAAVDEVGLEKPVACVVPVPGHAVDSDALVAWCREGLARYKRPRAVVVMAELPKTATGKIRRNVLREQVRDVLIPAPSESVVTG